MLFCRHKNAINVYCNVLCVYVCFSFIISYKCSHDLITWRRLDHNANAYVLIDGMCKVPAELYIQGKLLTSEIITREIVSHFFIEKSHLSYNKTFFFISKSTFVRICSKVTFTNCLRKRRRKSLRIFFKPSSEIHVTCMHGCLAKVDRSQKAEKSFWQ